MAEDAKGAFPGDGADAATARAPEPETSRPVFVAPAMVAQTGASMVKGGRRLSGRVCLTWKGTGTCAFGDACRFLHPAPPSRVPPNNSIVPPLGYVTHKAQQQLGADPSRSLLAEILESSGLFRRVADASLCAVLWAQSFTTGALYDSLPDGAFVNHFPNSVAITHKHRLVLSLRSTPGGRRRRRRGLLPAEARLREPTPADDADADADADETKTVSLKKNSKSANESSRRETGKRPIRWIVKRSVGGEGRGIAVCADAEAVLKRVRGDAKSRVAPTSLPVERRKANDETPKRDADGRKAPSVGVGVGASHVVQRYVPRPLRVFGRKVDLRVYVLVTGWGTADADARGERLERTSEGPLNAPLGVRAYAYAEGLVRFAAAPYDAFDADEARHLTNNALATAREHQSAASGFSRASSNAFSKPSSKPREGPDAEAHFKRNWSFEAFGAFLDESRGAGSFASVWARVRATARVAVEAARPAVLRGLAALSRNTRRRHFELLGLDVLVDEDLRVWLLEVNSAPSLVAGTRRRGRVSETHHALKGGLIADAMNLLDRGRGGRRRGADDRSGGGGERARARAARQIRQSVR